MQSIIDRHYQDNPEYGDIRKNQVQARNSGVAAVVIGTGVAYVILKLTKMFKNQPKYIPLVSLGIGACCGYIRSLSIIYKFKNQQKQKQLGQENKNEHIDQMETQEQVLHSKYGDANFFKEEKQTN